METEVSLDTVGPQPGDLVRIHRFFREDKLGLVLSCRTVDEFDANFPWEVDFVEFLAVSYRTGQMHIDETGTVNISVVCRRKTDARRPL